MIQIALASRKNTRKEKIKMKTKAMPKRKCAQCGKQFLQNREKKIFCSSRCRFARWAKMHPRVSIEQLKSV